ncbi:dynein axonemal assembly factor 4 [Amyelois transitella]|uniref:dynein axonemal assembly factor 4 n=1 Tax=Amyelois transitella TaxID=680683 RepID=UPI002990450C|nr:dynein axonemal assembly factor 4 [Amyelois transitella]
MPILVKDFTWTQTMDTLHIRIPISPVFKEKVDIFTFDSYVKIHFSPFLFEVFLLHDIDNDKSKCLVKDDIIILDLVKIDSCNWENLEKELTKPEKMKLKQEILEKSQAKAKQEAEDKHIKKTQLDRFTVQRAMDIDTMQHNLMESRRDNERKSAMDALENWRVTSVNKTNNFKEETNKTSSGVKIVELPPSDDEEDKKKAVTTVKKVNKQSLQKKPVKTPVRSEYIEKKKEETAKRVLPKLREAGELIITHTPRTFPTPSRESTALEEETWLKNVTMARRATGFVSEDLRPEEQDPQWCKEKGDEFFRNGNFLGAISAYTHGITLSDKLPSLFANRAATHFALGNFNKCLNDCSTALDLMKPHCEGNRRSRGKCIARRAAALVRLGYLSKGIDEMKAAVKLLPEDEDIKKDLYDMERAWEQNPDSD